MMADVKHTPGPWHAIEDTVFSGLRGQHFVASCEVGAENWSARKANALLIGAAPELLDALCDAYRFITQPQVMTPEKVTYRVAPYNALAAKIRAAIAKAGGQS